MQVYREFIYNLNDVDLIIYESLELLIHDSQIMNRLPAYEYTKLINDAELMGHFGYTARTGDEVEMGIWSKHNDFFDVLYHELNHVDHAAIQNLYRTEEDEETIVTVLDSRIKELNLLIVDMATVVTNPEVSLEMETDLRKWRISIY